MNRRTLAVTILAAWVAALGWLGAREWSLRGKINLTGRQIVSPGAAYYRVAARDSQVGYALTQVDTLAPTDTSPALVLLQHRVLFRAGNAPRQRHFELFTAAYLTTDLRLWRAEVFRGDEAGTVRWRMRVDHDTLRTMIVTAEDSFLTVTPLDTVPIPVDAVPLWIATYGRPRPGRAVSVPAIDLGTLARRRVTWTATAESTFTVPDSAAKLPSGRFVVVTIDTLRAWRLSGTDRSVQVHTWVDVNGFPLRWWTGGGLTLERDAFEPTMEAFRALSDTVTSHAPMLPLASADPASLERRSTDERTVLLAGAEYPPLESTGPTQRISGDTIETNEPHSWRGTQAFRPLEPLPMQNPRFAPDLLPEPRLSPEDTMVTARARLILGGSTNAREAAGALQTWMHAAMTTLDPATRAGMRPAGAVLAARAGTPEELAILTVALARRMGLPAREVGGLLFTPQGPRLHSWAEVFVGDWLSLDPTQPGWPATPAHLRLVTGGSGDWTDLLPLAGGLVATAAPRELR